MSIKKLFSYVGEYKKYAFLTPLMVIGEVIFEIYIPYLMSKIIDVGIGAGDTDYVVKTGLTMIALAGASLCLGIFSARFAAMAATGLSKNVRNSLFSKIQDFSFANIDKFSTASLVTRLTADVTNSQMAFMMAIRVLVRAPIMLISATIMAVTINASLARIFLIAIPVLGASLLFISTRAFPRFKEMLTKYDAMNASVQENLVAIRVVKAFVRRDFENKKFNNASTELMDFQVKAERIIIFSIPIMQFTMYACMIALAWFGGNQIIAGSMLTGQLFSFLSYIMQILISLMMITMVFVNLILSRASVERIVQVLDEKVDIADNPNAAETTVKDGSVVFENVSFGYGKEGSALNLADINLEIKSGETIGIIGGTGSSKTSLVQLIPRLYDVAGGRVLVGGRDVRDYTIKTLRDAVAMVLQKNVLFSGTIKENLKWGDENATDAEIQEACRAACAHEFIMSFPGGYETDLGQGGVNVSGGQKQRLCIARALLKKPKIIILDDSTSAVDTATDSQIRKAFREKLSDTTTIIIAQRVASVMDADRIVVLEDGRINGVGTHNELLESNEIYKEVYMSQQKGAA